MKNFLNILFGLCIMLYLFYVVGKLLMVIFQFGEGGTWEDIVPHLIFVVFVLFLIFLGGFVAEMNEATEEDDDEKQSDNIPRQETKQAQERAYNQYLDKLEYTVYQQKFETGWSDSDGDYQYHSTEYATLRFYEDGTVIGIRNGGVPKIDYPESFTMKGKWELTENKLSFNLEKVVEIDDEIEVHITDADRREMKYYGAIADNHVIINEGEHKGMIWENTIKVENFTFLKMKQLKLIITASEGACNAIERAVANHPLVIETYQDTGNWYTNGETGPEWFTVSIYTQEKWQNEIDKLVDEKLKENGINVSNRFWDHA